MTYYHSSYKRNVKKKKSPFRTLIIVLLLLLITTAGVFGYLGYQIIYSPNVWTEDTGDHYIYIGNEDSFDDVKTQLYSEGYIIHRKNFEILAKYKKYPENIKAGRYAIENGMSNNDLINMLRIGNQEPVKLLFNNIRLKEDLADKISKQINIERDKFLSYLNDTNYVRELGFELETVKSMFIPNTYFIYWNTDTEEFIERMKYEYTQFWDDERKQKAAQIDLSLIEISILASIVEKETQKNDEKARIAGVYINRLQSGWRLQADPTLIYALGDFKIKRVLNIYKEIDSPYNTYKFLGLPPGPICIPSIASIDAVLNAEDHSYFFFCAKPDYSGYHNFAKTSKQHNRNARAYREFLNKEKIFK